jgi:hypothetical protein
MGDVVRYSAKAGYTCIICCTDTKNKSSVFTAQNIPFRVVSFQSVGMLTKLKNPDMKLIKWLREQFESSTPVDLDEVVCEKVSSGFKETAYGKNKFYKNIPRLSLKTLNNVPANQEEDTLRPIVEVITNIKSYTGTKIFMVSRSALCDLDAFDNDNLSFPSARLRADDIFGAHFANTSENISRRAQYSHRKTIDQKMDWIWKYLYGTPQDRVIQLHNDVYICAAKRAFYKVMGWLPRDFQDSLKFTGSFVDETKSGSSTSQTAYIISTIKLDPDKQDRYQRFHKHLLGNSIRILTSNGNGGTDSLIKIIEKNEYESGILSMNTLSARHHKEIAELLP